MGRLSLSIAGRHNVGNATVAAAIATHCGHFVAPGDSGGYREFSQGQTSRSQLLGQLVLPGKFDTAPR